MSDGVLPFSWAELFVGVPTGATYTDATQFCYQCFDCGGFGGQWDWSPLMRVRGGFEVTTTRPLIVGLDVRYMLFAKQFSELHWAELHRRIGVAF